MTIVTQTEASGSGNSSSEGKETYVLITNPADSIPTDSETPHAAMAPLVRSLDQLKNAKVILDIEGQKSLVTLEPKADPDLYSIERGIPLSPLQRPLPPQSFADAAMRGFGDAKRSVMEVFGTIRALATQRVSRKLLGGPVTIATAAYASASDGLGSFFKFLGILSINLAVMNFLPIPPLDGGQMCFLIGEKIKGSPLPERVQVAFTMVGLSAVLSLMIMVLYQDLLRVFGLM
jgi:regulator of sigma E protease